jgi:polysaccharide export outer membrane protein
LLCVITALLVTGCSTIPKGTPPNCPEPQEQVEYKINPGDNLEVFVWRNPELSTAVPVRPDGRISIPLIEDMVAANRTPTQLARDMELVLQEYLRNPKVNIIVASQGSANSIQVVGEVTTPKAVPFREGIRLLDIIVEVGGLTDFAAGNRSIVSREIDGQRSECDIAVKHLLSGDMTQNIKLYPGDVVVVPESRL